MPAWWGREYGPKISRTPRVPVRLAASLSHRRRRAGARLRLIPRTPRCTLEELMRTALLFVIVVAMVATGLWLFVAGLFFESETNIWYAVSGGWLIGLGSVATGRGEIFVAPLGLRRDMNRAIAFGIVCGR